MDMRKESEREPQGGKLTELREPAWRTAGVYLVFAVLGAGVGWLVGLLADWLVTLSWTPMQKPTELVASLPDVVLPVAGFLAGLVLGAIAQHEQLAISLSNETVVLVREGRRQELSREAVATVLRDGKQLVVLGHDGGELARHEYDLNTDRVADAFVRHGYAWADADPYKDDFRRWVPDLPGLPDGANALLKARQEALEKDGSGDDVRELRDELARLGVVVKDEKRRQHVRTFGSARRTRDRDGG
ncbi:hypothetical protein ACFQHO_10765 [Actinomadura yumaensis]|uniref:DUF308 domain-containing protein n=2 Tax=Thermomonosporaceae TaxID=2012 RepID=A0ABW2CK77_9ACTN